ncbi:MAG: M20/M25/M40 family metallo-hydrolase [Deltaproteobacteria bacterium]|nr:M20/M25/M40 family metallo-hydrolase [Deltaproteobacteria bacterium]
MSVGRTVALVALAACAQPGRADDVPAPAPVTSALPAPLPAANSCVDGKPYDAAVFRDRVTWLAAPELAGRFPGTPGDTRTRAFIAERFACLGLVPAGADGSYEQPFTDDGDATANIVGYVKGTDDDADVIVIGAHHDHLGGGYLGANDNASGVVALLAIAQAIQQRTSPPKRTIVFATFGAEERGMRGSYHYVAHSPEALPLARVVQFINLDMVGTHASRGFVAALGTFRGLAATGVLAKLDDRYPELDVGFGGVARGSDHEPFCKQGIPYVFFWTPDQSCYHRKCDTAVRVDYPRMIDIAALAGDLTQALADSDADLADVRRRRGCGR